MKQACQQASIIPIVQELRQQLAWLQPVFHTTSGQQRVAHWLDSVQNLLICHSQQAKTSSDGGEFPEATWKTALALLTAARAAGEPKTSSPVIKNGASAASASWETLWQNFQQEEEALCAQEMNDEIAQAVTLRAHILATVLLIAGSHLPETIYVQIWEQLFQRMWELKKLCELPRGLNESPVSSLLMRGELAVLGGLIFQHIPGSNDLYKSGAQVCGEELFANTDNDGTPHASLIPDLPNWIDIFYRCQLLSEAAERKLLNHKSLKRLHLLLERLASLTREDGQLVLLPHPHPHWARSLVLTIGQQHPLKRTPWGEEILRKWSAAKKSSGSGRKRIAALPDESAATQSDWSHLACLRNNWYPGSDLLAITHHQPHMSLDCSLLGIPFLSGIWQTEVSVGESELQWEESWSALCWYNEAAGDYLELRLELPDCTIDRQLFLSRTDHLALLSDTVKTRQPGSTASVRWQLPVASGWKAGARSPERRERLLKNGPYQVRLLPLSLPQQTVERAPGRLSCSAEQIEWQQTGQTQWTMPLLIDWSPVRNGNRCDWTQLTITQERQTLTPQQAFAARARIGKHQWLFLRNIEFTGLPRAVLGMHTDAESVFAEFPGTGVPERLVEVYYEA